MDDVCDLLCGLWLTWTLPSIDWTSNSTNMKLPTTFLNFPSTLNTKIYNFILPPAYHLPLIAFIIIFLNHFVQNLARQIVVKMPTILHFSLNTSYPFNYSLYLRLKLYAPLIISSCSPIPFWNIILHFRLCFLKCNET